MHVNFRTAYILLIISILKIMLACRQTEFYILPVLPPSTAMLTPFTYDAAGDARNAATAAISDGWPKRFIGISSFIFFSTTSINTFPLLAVVSITEASLWVVILPGKRLLTVILNCPSSLAIVLAHEATAPRIVLDTPKFFKGIFTEVDTILIMRPYTSFFIEGTTAFVRM